jgi:hypothetical protein
VRAVDQRLLRARMASSWDLWCIDPPGSGWRAWTGEDLVLPSFQVKARNSDHEFDIFLEATDDDVWAFRRDPRIRLPLKAMTVRSRSGLPVVRPEVQLLYMAKHLEAKNQRDFEVAQPRMDEAATAWLSDALALAHPGHPWLESLL